MNQRSFTSLLTSEKWLSWLLLAVALLARFHYVSLYAGYLPFWDQWDAEADHLFRPWMDGSWHWSMLFAPHNEHRIAATRLLALTLFELNHHQWDNLVEAYATAGVFAAMHATLYSLLRRGLANMGQKLALLIFMAVLAALPFSWENALSGFQNQFYFMAIATLAMVGIAAYGSGTRRDVLWLLGLGGFSLFTMASGVLAAIAVLAALALRSLPRLKASPLFVLYVVVEMLLVIAAGFVLRTTVPGHEILASHGLVEHFTAILLCMDWPFQPSRLAIRTIFAIVLWLPSLAWGWRLWRRGEATRFDMFVAGMLVWLALQYLAIAHARGHDMRALASRYMDIPAMALALNACLALSLISDNHLPRKALGLVTTILFLAASLAGLRHREPLDMAALLERHTLTVIQTRHVRDYYADHRPSDLEQPFLQIPYPNPGRLQSLLDNPSIRSSLPRLDRANYFSHDGLGVLSLLAMHLQAPHSRVSNYPNEVINTPH